MLKNVRGFIYVDDYHVIIHAGMEPARSKDINEMCKQVFTDHYDLPFWKRMPKPQVDSCFKMLPSWFDRAIAGADEDNDWEKYPFVALRSYRGIISMTPFR